MPNEMRTVVPNKLNTPDLWTERMGEVVAKSAELAADAYNTAAGLEAIRAAYLTERSFWNQGGPEPAKVREEILNTEYGPVGVRAYYPVDEPNLPGIVYIHGGGFVVGSIETHDRITRILAERSGAVVLSMDYSLSPEARHPQALLECVGVVETLREKAQDWGIKADDISLAGDSAGAFFALAAYLYLREEKDAAQGIRSLLLFYGYYGLRDSVSRRLMGGTWDGLTEEDFAYYLDLYLADPSQRDDPYIDLFRQDLTKDLPPAYICAGVLDPVHDDSQCLAKIMTHFGLPNRFEAFEGVIHGFLHNSSMLDEANDALEHAAAYFREQGK